MDKDAIMKQQEVMLAKFLARREQNNVMDSRHLRKFENQHQPSTENRAR